MNGWFWWRKCSGAPFTRCSFVVEAVGREERHFCSYSWIFMTWKCLASDWLTELSVTVIKPIKLPERLREREKERETQREWEWERHTESVRTRETHTESESERKTERDRQRQRQRENHWAPCGFWLIEYRKKSHLGAPRPGHSCDTRPPRLPPCPSRRAPAAVYFSQYLSLFNMRKK